MIVQIIYNSTVNSYYCLQNNKIYSLSQKACIYHRWESPTKTRGCSSRKGKRKNNGWEKQGIIPRRSGLRRNIKEGLADKKWDIVPLTGSRSIKGAKPRMQETKKAIQHEDWEKCKEWGERRKGVQTCKQGYNYAVFKARITNLLIMGKGQEINEDIQERGEKDMWRARRRTAL